MGKIQLLIILTILSLGLGFQNCSSDGMRSYQGNFLTSKSSSNGNGNGEGYGGKSLNEYIRRAHEGECEPVGKTPDSVGGSQLPIKSAIEKRDSGYYMTIEDCNEVKPARQLTNGSVEVLDHNSKFAIYENRLFESLKDGTDGGGRTTKMLCRGRGTESAGGTSIQDVEIFEGVVMVTRALYSSVGELLEYERQELSVQVGANNPSVFEGLLASPESFRLSLNATGQEATLVYDLKFGAQELVSTSLTQQCYQD